MQSRSLDILKEAILLERRGRAFYQKVAEETEHQAVRAFFLTMVSEEERHMHILGEQYKSLQQNGTFAPLAPEDVQGQPLPDMVLSEEVKQQLAAADFEAAAVSAAMLLEERAVALYGERAEQAEDPEEKALYYAWLAGWEQGHLSFLTNLDRDIKETIWNDNQFWPF